MADKDAQLAARIEKQWAGSFALGFTVWPVEEAPMGRRMGKTVALGFALFAAACFLVVVAVMMAVLIQITPFD